MFIYNLFILTAIQGGFSEWEWSGCSKTCGEGTREGERHCNNPVPQNGGTCDGELTKVESCKVMECPG